MDAISLERVHSRYTLYHAVVMGKVTGLPRTILLEVNYLTWETE